MIPKEVNIGAIMHNVQVSENLVVFSQQAVFWGCHSRLSFSREKPGALWYFEFSETFGRVPVCHIVKAFAFVKEWFGGDFDFNGKNPGEAAGVGT